MSDGLAPVIFMMLIYIWFGLSDTNERVRAIESKLIPPSPSEVKE